jgi:hypothetical protein
MSNLQFDATDIAPAQPFEVIPAGKYVCQVVNSEMRPTKDGAGAYLWMELEILEGEYAGRKVFDRLNIQNANQQAVDIARRNLSSLCHAIGELQVENSEQLHWKPVLVTVRVRPASGEYDASNDIRGYAPVPGGGAVATNGGSAQPVAAAKPAVVAAAGSRAAVAAGKTPPWRTHKQ